MRRLTVLASLGALASAAELTQITDFGPNPTNASFYLYVPDSFKANSPLLVYPHWCHGTAQDAFGSKQWRSIADEFGFPVIYPSSPWTVDHCWDVSSYDTLHHNEGGDSLSIASMVRWTLENYPIDSDRVFVSGTSSGAMMTNVMIGAYPELFAAGSAYAGVPFGCYAGDGYAVWNADCAEGRTDKTGEQWDALVLEAFPAYTGPRPKMQVFHGSVDNVVNVTNYYNEIKLWTTVLKTGSTPSSVAENDPVSGWTKSVYGEQDLFESFLADGVDHNIPDQIGEVIRFFDLDCTGETCFSRKSLPS
ncbi:hypothetical protein NLU13_8679 [Sarocladium strictum]|uniref:Carboxylic ester hydrolase n=1 Tax=Sarocladium strictum TaxID=5046 RepID=A0AA39GC45_SARSR|nr:hypothetical protein NLU13_8679 [Sarocladium strictum]